MMKLVVGEILLNYDIKFLDEGAPRTFTWGSSVVPRSGTEILFKRRVEVD
jgi:hypothetical protein